MIINTVSFTAEGTYLVNDDAYVPLDPANKDYQAVQVWIAEGNTVDPYDPPPAAAAMTNADQLEAMTGLSVAQISTVLGV